MTSTISQAQWDYYLANKYDYKNKSAYVPDTMCKMMDEIIGSGYCLSPDCQCSNAQMWRTRKSKRDTWQAYPGQQQEQEYDDLPDTIKLDLRNEWLKISLSIKDFACKIILPEK